jgi:hypothetical protein
MTMTMQQIIGPAGQLSLSNAPLLLIGQGPWVTVVTGLSSTVIQGTKAVQQVSDLKSIDGCDADAVADAYRTYVAVSQQTLAILTGKGVGLSNAIPFITPPVTAVLRQLESVNDALGLALIDRVSGDANAVVKSGAAQLDVAVEAAIDAYAGS